MRVRELNRVGHGVADVRGRLQTRVGVHEDAPDLNVLGLQVRRPERGVGDVKVTDGCSDRHPLSIICGGFYKDERYSPVKPL